MLPLFKYIFQIPSYYMKNWYWIFKYSFLTFFFLSINFTCHYTFTQLYIRFFVRM